MGKLLYSKYCHLHKEIMTTFEIKRIRSKGTNQLYEEPLYFCGQCKSYYYYVDGMKVDCKIKYGTTSKKTIHILNKAGSSSFERKQKTKDVNDLHGKILTEVNPTDPIVLLIGEIFVDVRVIPDGIILKKCFSCGKNLRTMYFNGGKELLFTGKQCPNCSAIYVPEAEIKQHSTYFKSLSNVNSEQTDKPIIDLSEDDISEENNSSNTIGEENTREKTLGSNNDIDTKIIEKNDSNAGLDNADNQPIGLKDKRTPAFLKNKAVDEDYLENNNIYSVHKMKKKLETFHEGDATGEKKRSDLKHITDDFGIEFDFSGLEGTLVF